MDELYEMILEVTKRPELYLGKPSLERLYAFIGGFCYRSGRFDYPCLDGFQAYIANQYDIRSVHNWAEIIRFFSGTEEEAFAAFVKHFMAFNGR